MSSASDSVAMDVDTTAPHSPASDSDDAYNSSNAKVYFGPLLSPEKKFAQILGPQTPRATDTDTEAGPFHLHQPQAHSEPLDIVTETDKQPDADLGGESDIEPEPVEDREGSPMLTILQQDEPSSALASRIIRAHDNPSPPPGAIRRLSGSRRRSSQLSYEFNLLGATNAESTEAPTPAGNDDIDVAVERLHVSSVSRSPTPTNASQKKRRSDLISFDSPVKDPTSSTSPDLASSSHLPLPSTVDDLLFSSPMRPTEDHAVPPETESELASKEAADAGSIFHMPESGGPARRRSARLSTLPRPNFSEMNIFGSPPKPLISITPTPSPTRKRIREGARNTANSRSTRLSSGSSSDVEPSGLMSPTHARARREKKRMKTGPTDDGPPRHADSLSPGSSQILTTLMTPGHTPRPNLPETQTDNADIGSTDVGPGIQGTTVSVYVDETTSRLSQIQRPPPGTFQTQFMSPTRGVLGNVPFQQSPLRMTLNFSGDTANRTPARRVPFTAQTSTQRVVNGQGGQFSKFKLNTPVFNRPTGNVDMSPQRVAASRPQPSIFGNVFSKGKEKELFTFIPPKSNDSSGTSGSIAIHLENAASSSKIDVPAGDSDQRAEHAKQAFSVIIEEPNHADNDVPVRPDPSEQLPQLDSTSVSNSSSSDCEPQLSQPSSSTVAPSRPNGVISAEAKSKIPRAGVLSKPASNLPLNRTSKLPMPASRQVAKSVANRSRLPSPVKPASRLSKIGGLSQSTNAPVQSTTNTIVTKSKRKISTNSRIKQTSQKPPSPKPIVIRQVLPGMFSNCTRATSAPASHIPTLPPPSSPVKHHGPTQARIIKEVVSTSFQGFDSRGTSSSTLQVRSDLYEEYTSEDKANLVMDTMQSQQQPTTLKQPQEVQADVTSAIPDIATLSMDEPRIRRSSRNRGSSQPETDVFGTVCVVSADTGNTRRRTGTGRSKSAPVIGAFYPPEGVALKALTNNNTTHNQRYHAQLETNIVRKPGNRPESPSLKLRTILEKQKEEQGRMREERAKRRRAPSSDSEDEGKMEVDDSIISVDATPSQHLRGPGEDEDYVTPEKVAKAIGKRVKWDRRLGTTVFLDEIIPSEVLPHRDPEKTNSQRGCLVSDASKIKLDSLGNPVNVDPLELAAEVVVVTKYVYDNDEEAQVYIPPPPKVTRSKSKRNK